MEKELEKRSGGKCELCSSTDNLASYLVPDSKEQTLAEHIFVCGTCRTQLMNPDSMDPNHWRCLNDSMWSEVAAVQVVAYRTLNKLRSEGWPGDLLDMMYLDDDTKKWALSESTSIKHLDVNGTVLNAGDTVVLIKDLKVKGTSMVAKRGTSVRRISLDPENASYIEGKVDGQKIVIITEYVKKS